MKEIPNLDIRKKIYNSLQSDPGLNLSTIAEKFNISVQLADYHLTYMTNRDLIAIDKKGGYKRYYVKGAIGSDDKKTLSLLQQDIPLNIVVFLLNNPNSKPQEIRKKNGMSPALLTYYLKKLKKYGIIAESISGGKKEYVIIDQEKIITLLIRYKQNVLLERFRGTWLTDISLSGKIPKDKN